MCARHFARNTESDSWLQETHILIRERRNQKKMLSQDGWYSKTSTQQVQSREAFAAGRNQGGFQVTHSIFNGPGRRSRSFPRQRLRGTA